jgi:hypothetical protein
MLCLFAGAALANPFQTPEPLFFDIFNSPPGDYGPPLFHLQDYNPEPLAVDCWPPAPPPPIGPHGTPGEVPEPATFAEIGVGLLTLGLIRTRGSLKIDSPDATADRKIGKSKQLPGINEEPFRR